MAEVFTDDGRIVTTEIPVLRGCMDDEKTGSAFLLDADNQYTDESHQWTQILGERSTIPISMVKATEYKQLQEIINKIYHESSEGAKLDQYQKAKNGDRWNRIMWLVFGPLGLMGLMYMVTVFVAR
jgi:hypothetical protein